MSGTMQPGAERGGRGRPVLVAGLGAVSPLGIGADALWSALLQGQSACGPSPPSPRGIPLPATAGTLGAAAQRLEEVVEARFLRRLSGLSRQAVSAAAMCVADASSSASWVDGGVQALRDATAVVLGTCYGCSAYHFEYYEKLFRNGLKDASPLLFSESVMNAAPGHIAIHLKLRGASLALVGGEEVGLTAVHEGLDRIRSGEARAVLAGGAEEYCDFVHAALAARGLISGEPGEPYSGSGRGTFLSEGAAFLLLEESGPQGPDGRAAGVFLAGAGMARAPGAAAVAVERAVRAALGDAGIAPEEVDLAVTSACGGRLDFAEAEGIARALRPHGASGAPELLLCAPKEALGEGFAFSSAALAVVAVKSLAEGRVPPARGLEGQGRLPAGLRWTGEVAQRPLRCAIAVAVSGRGNAVAAVFGRWEIPGLRP